MIRIARRRPDENKVRRRPFLKELADVGRHALVVGVIVRRFKVGTLVLKNFEQLVLQHLVHLADLVDEENAAVRVRHKPGLWFGYAAVREALLRSLIDGVMHRAKQRVRHVARIPTQCRPVRLHERCGCRERRNGAFLCRLQHKARRRRLAHAWRTVEEEVLRVGRGQFRHERPHGTLLSDDLVKAARAQQLHDGLCEVNLLQCLQILALLLVVRRLCAGALL